MTENELNVFLDVFYQLKEKSIDPRYGFDDEWDIFIKKVLPLSPKSYGTKIQNRIIEFNSLESVKANEDKGDFKKGDEYFEIKCSLVTVTNKTANITGIRKWQVLDGYYIFIVDARDYKNIATHSFMLSNKAMENELETLKATPINGTKKANEDNDKPALRFGLSLESENFKRWQKEYLFTSDSIVTKR